MTLAPDSLRSPEVQQLFAQLETAPITQRLNAEQLEVIYALAYAHLDRQQVAQALPLFALLVQYAPTRRHYLAGLAYCLRQEQRLEEAIDIYSVLLMFYPDAYDQAVAMAECHILAGRRDEGAALLETVAQQPENEASATRARAMLRLLAGESQA